MKQVFSQAASVLLLILIASAIAFNPFTVRAQMVVVKDLKPPIAVTIDDSIDLPSEMPALAYCFAMSQCLLL